MEKRQSATEQLNRLLQRDYANRESARHLGFHALSSEGRRSGYLGSPEELRENARTTLGQDNYEGLEYLVELPELAVS